MQCDYAFANSGSNSFGVITRGDFEKETAKGFFGAGPADDFLRETFGITLSKLGECFDAYVCMKEARTYSSSCSLQRHTNVRLMFGCSGVEKGFEG